MMLKLVLKYSLVVAGLIIGLTGTAQAGEDESLQKWASQAGSALSAEMKYSNFAIRTGAEGSPQFKVTVSRNGTVKSINSIRLSSSSVINSSAKKALKYTEFPALPADFDRDELTFAVRMNYAIANSASEERALKRQGRVSSRQIASKSAPMVASIEILDDIPK